MAENQTIKTQQEVARYFGPLTFAPSGRPSGGEPPAELNSQCPRRFPPVIIAGPCSVESEEQILAAARAVKAAGATALRGGAFKPRTSPKGFQGLGEEGLKLLARARQETGLPVVTEVMESSMIDLVAQYADVLQIGSRNMQNFALLKEVGRAGKPILLKRGLAATLHEWLSAAEYITASGNDQVILCERGIRTFETYTRNTLDLGIAVAAKQLSGFPVIVDPSHAAGRRELIPALSKAALAAGMDGLIVEVHPDPPAALSDQEQQLTPDEFVALMKHLDLFPASALNSLPECRAAIDKLDDQIIALLRARMEVSVRVGELKAGSKTVHLNREREIVDRLCRNAGHLIREEVTAIWQVLFGASRRVQDELKGEN
jgi:3-deoxy-7-phosphoheptulonate synthase